MKKKDHRYETILFCAALCPESKHVFSVALDMAVQHRARLIVLHVIEPRHRYSGILMTEEGDVILTGDVIQKFKCKLSDFYLSRIGGCPPCKIDFIIVGGIPWTEILRVARKEKVDHIVMGCSDTEAPEIFEGEVNISPSDTARLVSAKAACSVSVVPEFARSL